MKRHPLTVLFSGTRPPTRANHWVCVVIFMGLLGCAQAQQPADVVLLSGNVYTMNSSQPNAEAVAIRDGRIVFVGSNDEAARFEGRLTRTMDVGGQTVLPGFIDAHGHVYKLGLILADVNLVGIRSVAEVRRAVIERQKSEAPGAWIRGRGWDQNDWTPIRFPTFHDLDGTEANPVYLRRVDGHAALLNRTALEECGITRDTPDPFGGKILRDENGDPTGVLIDRAEEIVRAVVPEFSLEEKVEVLKRAVAHCVQFGLTGVHDAGMDESLYRAYRHLIEKGELPMRVYAMVDSDDSTFAHARIAEGPVLGPDHLFTVRAIKLYIDGALGSRGAALLAPYSDEPGNTGLLKTKRKTMDMWIAACLRNGFQVCAHAIGDGGNRIILDAYEDGLKVNPRADHRFRVEHAQVIAPADIKRFASLGVIPSMQPTHATSDMYWAQDRVGDGRIKGAYAWRQLMDAGSRLALGSDFPVESANPLWGVFAAVTRQDHEGWPEGGWRADERMTVEEAVRGFTVDAAHAEFAEDVKGSIEVGKLADLVVLDADIFKIPATEILTTGVVYTIVGGRVVFSSGHPEGGE